MEIKQKPQDEFINFLQISNMFFCLKEETIEKTVNWLMSKFDDIYSLSFQLFISQMLYSSYIANMNDLDLYLCFINKFASIKSNFLDVFSHFLLNENSKETLIIFYHLFKQNLLNSKIIKNITENIEIPYFIHYIVEEEPMNLKINRYLGQIYNNYEELSENDWELHQKYIEEGHSPNEIATIIRNDEVDKLQEISSPNDFDINQIIEPSLYERSDFINGEDVTLIDYAAFFKSIKCFKYLLMNGANVNNTGKYAVAGGNLEIIHLCEQNHSTFEDAHETAIEFHRNDIFKYIYENKIIEKNNLEELGKNVFLYCNYEIFVYLETKGMKINASIINESARIGNLYLVKYFINNNNFPNDILVFSSQSGNIELVKYILKQKVININTKDTHLFYLIFILIILYFKIIFGNYLNYLKQHLLKHLQMVIQK